MSGCLPEEPTLGAALRAAREAAGKTVERMSYETKIRATLIRDLEDDHTTSSGGAVYARGHVKAIASALQLDPKPLLAQFDLAQGSPAAPGRSQPEPLDTVVPSGSLGRSEFALSSAAALRPERRGPRWGVAVAGAAAVLVGLVVVGSLAGKPAKTAVLGVATTPTPTVASTRSAAPVVQAPPAGLSASLPPVVGAQLRVRVIGGTSWVSISNPTATLFEGILGDGQFKDFHDPTRLKVVVGNGLVVNLNCGGHDSGPAGSAGSVKKFACTSTGLVAT